MRRVVYIILTSLGLLLLSFDLKAQWDLPYTQFWDNKTSVNPSFAGENDKISASVLYKQHWDKAKDAPQVVQLSANSPLKFLGLAHGVGIVLSNTNVAKERNSFMAAQYTYKHKVGKGWLNAGLQLGVYDINFDAASCYLNIDSINDEKTVIANLVDKKRVDLSAGLSWTSNRFFVGVGVNHINEPKYYSLKLHKDNDMGVIANDSTLSKIPISYNLMAGCNIRLFNTLFELQPMVFARIDDVSYDLNAAMQLVWNEKYSAGTAWRGDKGYSIFAGLSVSNMSFKYAFDQNRNGIGKDAGSNHEVMVQYNFDLDLFRPKPQPHKSIRLL